MNAEYFTHTCKCTKDESAVYFVEDMLVYIFKINQVTWEPPRTSDELRQQHGNPFYCFTADVGRLLVFIKNSSFGNMLEETIIKFRLKRQFSLEETVNNIVDAFRAFVKPHMKSGSIGWISDFFLYLTVVSDLTVQYYQSGQLNKFVDCVASLECIMTLITRSGQFYLVPIIAKRILHVMYKAPAA